jgi:hypothetical protein
VTTPPSSLPVPPPPGRRFRIELAVAPLVVLAPVAAALLLAAGTVAGGDGRLVVLALVVLGGTAPFNVLAVRALVRDARRARKPRG